MALRGPSPGAGDPRARGGGVTQVLASGEPVHGVEVSRREAGGGRIAWEMGAAPLRGADGELQGVVVSMRDITDRQAAEEALREAEERLRSLVETIPAVTYVTPSDWTRQPYLYVSPQVEELLGYPAEEWTSDPGLWYRILHPEDAERAVAESEAVDLTGEPFESEYRLIAKDGRVVWVLDRARQVPGPDGQPHLWQGVLFDITEHKRAQAELVEREAMLRAIFESEPECVKLVGPDGTLLQMNPAGLAMIEADAAEQVLGSCIYPIVAEEHRGAFRALTEAAFRGDSGTLEFDIVGLKGTRRTLETHAAPLRAAGGEVIACLSISRDVTERKRAAAELEATLADLRRVNEARLAALSRLVRAQEEERRRIAEDLHDDPVQRLTAVGIRLATLTESAEDEAQRERLRALEGAIADVIGGLRSMMFRLRPPELDGDGLVDAVREHLARLADEAGWEWRVEGELRVRPSAEVASAAYRIIQEALRNAQKHAAAARVTINLGSDATTLRGEVRDDGAGFDPSSVPGHHEGHLGLVSMRERAELFGGTCEVESAPGRGTLVRFCLPLAGGAGPSRYGLE
ncbi:MAG TPA: PAS domain S-box protein [Actinomycetota bacterium]|nr:PAS domain S-box protein [Actinomycetota bacterium]